MDSTDYQRRKRARWIRDGFCVHCGKRPAAEGHKVCEDCRALYARNNQIRRKTYQAAGHCIRCGVNNPAPGRKYCLDCLDILKLHHGDWYYRHKAAGQCVHCGGPVPEGLATCSVCRERSYADRRDLRQRREASGYCKDCGKVKVAGTGYKTCPTCREKARLRQRKRKEKQLGIWKGMF